MINVNQEGTDAMSLVSSIKQLNIEVPEAVTAEVKSYRDSMKTREHTRREYESAVSDLQFVEIDKVDDARQRVVDASARLCAVTDGVETAVISAAGDRLNNQVYDASADWESAVVERFNEIVQHYELNEVAADLPNFGDLKSFNVLSLNRQQGHAVDRWRTTAADYLHPLWSAYQRLAKFHGHEVGPVDDAVGIAVNLYTACVLGDPGTWGRTVAAADTLTKVAAGVDSVRAYAPITPFVVPVLAGYDLHLHTLSGAGSIRSSVQGI